MDVNGVRVAVRRGLAVSLTALAALLAALVGSIGLAWPAAAIGLGCGAALAAALARGAAAAGTLTLGPADVVTLARATLACAVAALVADSFLQPASVAPLVALAGTAWALDAVDGRVARSTRTASALGARFDGEADAFLILVLSVHVAGSGHAWAVVLGAARYAFWMAGRVWPWLRATLPRRDWRKLVTAVVGIVLVVAASDVPPAPVTEVALAVALVLLAESFGRDVLWTWHHRASPRTPVPDGPALRPS